MLPGFTSVASIYRSTANYRLSPVNVVRPGAGFALCNTPGLSCCPADSQVKTRHCDQSVGCNIISGKCEPCGGLGQVCCDGPYTGFSGKDYSNVLFDSPERVESCDSGLRCDATLAPDGVTWLGTRRCQPCGTTQGGPCCAPDDRYGLGRCFSDAASGAALVCNNPSAGAQGTCVPCGAQVGQPVCLTPGGYPCVDGLVAQNGICVLCGSAGNPVCDHGAPCDASGSVPDATYTTCVRAGGANQPCLQNGTCGYADLFCNSKKICQPCGDPGGPCCPATATSTPCSGSGECRQNTCFSCGLYDQPVCITRTSCDEGTEVDGWCRHCGQQGQPCCREEIPMCSSGLTCDDDDVCTGSPQSSGSGGQLKTCSGQAVTFTAQNFAYSIEGTDGCVSTAQVYANSADEALKCAQAKYGNALILTELQDVRFAVTCFECWSQTFPARDEASAMRCAQSTYPNCTVEQGDCPPGD